MDENRKSPLLDAATMFQELLGGTMNNNKSTAIDDTHSEILHWREAQLLANQLGLTMKDRCLREEKTYGMYSMFNQGTPYDEIGVLNTIDSLITGGDQAASIRKNNKTVNITDKLEWNESYLLVEGEKITNFLINIVTAYDLIDRENPSISKERRYDIEVNSKGKKLNYNNISAYQLRSRKWASSIPGLSIFNNKKMSYERIVEELIDRYKGEVTKVYNSSGWIKIDDYLWDYVTSQGCIGNPNLKIKSDTDWDFRINDSLLSGKDLFSEFINMGNLTRSTPTAKVCLLYTLQSFMYSLFKEAGVVPKYILSIVGERGTLKTSIANNISQIRKRGETTTSEYTFMATGAGLEAGLPKHRDMVFLVDDLMPSSLKDQKSRIESNLELMVRLFGDNTMKQRNTDFSQINDKKKVEYRACGGCITTGEYFCGVESSISRMLICNIKKGDVDTHLLEHYQQRLDILPSFLWDFLKYIAHNSKQVINYIKDMVMKIRSENTRRYNALRYAEYYAQLKVTLDLLMDYAEDRKTNSNLNMIYEQWHQAVINTVLANSDELKLQNPVVLIVQAINWAIECGGVFCLEVGDSSWSNEKSYIFYDSEFYYIQPEVAYSLVNLYAKSNTLNNTAYTHKMLVNYLSDAGLLEPYDESGVKRNSGKRPCSRGDNRRYLRIYKGKFMDVVMNASL